MKEAQPHQFKYDAFFVRKVGIDHCCAEPKMRSHSTNIQFVPQPNYGYDNFRYISSSSIEKPIRIIGVEVAPYAA